jgi:hypothetical protein
LFSLGGFPASDNPEVVQQKPFVEYIPHGFGMSAYQAVPLK